MWQTKYAKEPFDLKLFVLLGLKMVKWICLSAVVGAICIGGIYYLKNVTWGGKIPYVVTQKLNVDYAVNPDTGTEYSYYVAYTWNDWIKSDLFLEAFLEKNSTDMPEQELLASYEMTLPADVRNPYLIVTHTNEEKAAWLSEALAQQLLTFAAEQKEIEEISVIDSTGPVLQVRDIRTFRAVMLGAVIGTFFALFAIAFYLILGEGIYVPETFAYRYNIPAAGYMDQEGVLSAEAGETVKYLFRDAKRIGITAVEAELDLTAVRGLFGEMEAICLPSPIQEPKILEYLRHNDGNLLLVQAGTGNGKAIETVLYLCKIHDVKITAVLLMNADRRLIEGYRFRMLRKKEGV